MSILGKSDQTSDNWDIKAIFLFSLKLYQLSIIPIIRVFSQLSLIPKIILLVIPYP